MAEQNGDSQRLPREDLRPLMAKRNGPGVVRMTVQLVGFSTSIAAVVASPVAGTPWAWAAVLVGGLFLTSFFPALHEAGHQTAFASDWLNEVVVALGAFLMLQAPSFFRQFHWEHHRETQNPETDPEIAGAPDLLDGWPSNPISYLLLASGQLLLIGKALFTVSSALLPAGANALWEKVFPFIRDDKRSRIAWESRLVVVLWVAIVWAGFTWVPHFWMVILMWPVSHVILGLYLMPEHTGLAHEGSQSHRTRTVQSNGLVRWFMWNMPYHSEHHEYPAVPFHAVPRLHQLWDPQIENRHSGYVAFHLEAIKRSFGWKPAMRPPSTQST